MPKDPIWNLTVEKYPRYYGSVIERFAEEYVEPMMEEEQANASSTPEEEPSEKKEEAPTWLKLPEDQLVSLNAEEDSIDYAIDQLNKLASSKNTHNNEYVSWLIEHTVNQLKNLKVSE